MMTYLHHICMVVATKLQLTGRTCAHWARAHVKELEYMFAVEVALIMFMIGFMVTVALVVLSARRRQRTKSLGNNVVIDADGATYHNPLLGLGAPHPLMYFSLV